MRTYDVKITYPTRALFLANSQTEMTDLLDGSRDRNATLTIWGKDEIEDADKLRGVIDAIGRDRIYLDVPDKLRARLNDRCPPVKHMHGHKHSGAASQQAAGAIMLLVMFQLAFVRVLNL